MNSFQKIFDEEMNCKRPFLTDFICYVFTYRKDLISRFDDVQYYTIKIEAKEFFELALGGEGILYKNELMEELEIKESVLLAQDSDIRCIYNSLEYTLTPKKLKSVTINVAKFLWRAVYYAPSPKSETEGVRMPCFPESI